MKKSDRLLIGLTLVNLCFITACVFTFKNLSAKEVGTAVQVFIGLMETFILLCLNCWFLFLRLPVKDCPKQHEQDDNVRQTLFELKARVAKNANSLEKINTIMTGRQLVNVSENASDLLSSVQAIFDSTLSVLETIEDRLESDKTYQNI